MIPRDERCPEICGADGSGDAGQRVEPRVDLRRILLILRARLIIVIVCTALGAGAAFLVSINLDSLYEAQATLIVGQRLSGASPDYNQLLVSQRLSATYASLATTRPNLAVVIEKLGLTETPGELARSVRADTALDSTLLTITAQSSDPSTAAMIANGLAMQLIDAVPELQGQQSELQASIDAALRSTREQIDTTQREIDDLAGVDERTPEQEVRLTALDARLVTLRATFASLVASTSGFDTAQLTLVEPAVPPTTPISPRTLLNVLIGALLGLFAGIALVLVRERLDDTVKTPADAEQTVGLPALGVIAQMPGDRKRSEIYRLAALLYPRSPATETYRMLRTNIEFATADAPIRSLLVTSSAPSEGKSVTASNLAIVFAQAGRRVLLIDGDLRRPGIHRLFDLPNTQGLTTLLRSDDVDYTACVRPTEQANLWVLPTGPLPADPAELVGSPRMVATMEHLESGYDLIIVDSPPVQSVADAAILSSILDATVLVIGAGSARRTTVRLAREALDRAGADVIGLVLNLLRDPAAVAYGGHYPGYMTDEAEHDEGFSGGPDKRPSSQAPVA